MFWLINKKKIFLDGTLNYRPDYIILKIRKFSRELNFRFIYIREFAAS